MRKTSLTTTKSMSNHIEEYFADSSQSKEVLTSKELFRALPDDVDIKTDLELREIILINKLQFNNDHLKDHGLRPVYKDFLNSYMRLKISNERKSRAEFVDMNRGQTKTDDVLDTMTKLNNASGLKK